MKKAFSKILLAITYITSWLDCLNTILLKNFEAVSNCSAGFLIIYPFVFRLLQKAFLSFCCYGAQ